MIDMLQVGREILALQPFSCLLGSEMTSFEPGRVELTLTIRSDLLQQFGFVHGGVLSYLADNALTFVGGSLLGPEVVTAEYKINYLRPARGERLIARAEALHAGRNQVVCRCDLFVDKGAAETLCAVAQGTITLMGKSQGDS